MRKFLLSSLLLAVFAVDCVSCAGVVPTLSADREAARLQELAKSVVFVDLDAIIARGMGTPDVKLEPIGWVGSGVVLAVSKRGPRTLVATNAHVCLMGEGLPPGAVPLEERLTVTGWRGDKHAAAVQWTSQARDLCLMSVEGAVGVPAELAPSDPPLLAPVERLGHDGGMRHGIVVATGWFSGRMLVRNVEFHMLSMVGTVGGSGSPVFYQGRVVSLFAGFEQVGGAQATTGYWLYAVPGAVLREALREALPGWERAAK